MLHELDTFFLKVKKANAKHIKSVLASVVSLNGSSYRKPGVRMLVLDNNEMYGAISGGCVEKEVLRQSQQVFSTNKPKMMVYDGRYRLGCEGVLYILLEPLNLDDSFFDAFDYYSKQRKPFEIISYFNEKEGFIYNGGSYVKFSRNKLFPLSKFKRDIQLKTFTQIINPKFRLIIVGNEHDAVQLCNYASIIGWEVTIIAPIIDEKSSTDFIGASIYLNENEAVFEKIIIDKSTAVVIMTHSFVSDLKYLLALLNNIPVYIGLLGTKKRKEKLIAQLMEQTIMIPDVFFDSLYGPCGLNIGAETPQEIAISIVAEILSVFRNQEPILLRDKINGIHD